MFAIVRTINGLGVSVLMVEQRARQCLAIADYGYVLEQGHNRLEGFGAGIALTGPRSGAALSRCARCRRSMSTPPVIRERQPESSIGPTIEDADHERQLRHTRRDHPASL